MKIAGEVIGMPFDSLTTILEYVLPVIIGSWIVIASARSSFASVQYDIDSGERTDPSKREPHFTAPLLPRFATSRRLYNRWQRIYISGWLILFVLAAFFWTKNTPDLSKYSETLGLWYVFFGGCPTIMAALLIPSLERMEFGGSSPLRGWLDLCLQRARIPVSAQTLYNKLFGANIRFEPGRIQRAVQCVSNLVGAKSPISNDYLKETDFNSRFPIIADWARTCYLFHSLEVLGIPDFEEIAIIPGLHRSEILRNFKILGEDIRAYRSHDSSTLLGESRLSNDVIKLKKQVCQYVACVLFSAYKNEDEVYEVVRTIGAASHKMPRYNFDVVAAILPIVVFSIAVFVISITYFKFTTPISILDSASHAFIDAMKASIKSLLIVFLPVSAVFIMKVTSPIRWKVVGAYSERDTWMPVLIGFCMGGCIGIVGLYILSRIGWLSHGEWVSYLPFSSLSAISGANAAIVIDMPARRFLFSRAVTRASFLGLILGTIFFLVGGVSCIIQQEILRVPIGNLLFIAAYIGAVGVIVGSVTAIFGEYCSRISEGTDEVNLALARYLDPQLPANFGHLTREELSRAINDKAADLSKPFLAFMLNCNLLEREGNKYGVTIKGYGKIISRMIEPVAEPAPIAA